MAKFIAKNKSVDNSDLHELDGFVPKNGTSILTWTDGTNKYERSSVYHDGKLTVKWYENGLKYTLKTEVSTKELKTVFKGDNWEQKFFKGDDTIKGSTQTDLLYGFDGNDTISGKGGVDSIYGGNGKDKLSGGGDGDLMYGGAGKDFLDGDTGVNSLTGGSGKDKFAFSAALTRRQLQRDHGLRVREGQDPARQGHLRRHRRQRHARGWEVLPRRRVCREGEERDLRRSDRQSLSIRRTAATSAAPRCSAASATAPSSTTRTSSSPERVADGRRGHTFEAAFAKAARIPIFAPAGAIRLWR